MYASASSLDEGKREGSVAGVLDGIRVLDFGRYIAGPFCAALLADLGAEVIRIERIGGGEDRWFIPVGAEPAKGSASVGGAMFLAMNRNKLGMTLDPAAAKGREIVRKLVATADVVVANLPPRVLRSLALDLDSLRQVKPGIILTTVTGFGAGGPLSHKHGFDGIGQAMSGAVYLSGTPEQPIALKLPWVDFGTACLSAFGTLAALIERGKTGRGQRVEGALLRTAIAFANATLIEQALTGANRVATVNRGFNAAPADFYRCRDGWIVTTVIGPSMFRRWTQMIGEEHWLADPRFADDQSRADHSEIISARMTLWCAERSCAEALAALEKASIVAGQLYSPQQALDDVHIRAAHLLEEVPHPALATTYPLAPTPVDLSETPGTYRRPAPLLGEHTDAILIGLGYGRTEIGEMRREGII
jgi:crotonobetainyl-CoA:carnitine CoA-transferase CaiB-like acyl-CoA transferase